MTENEQTPPAEVTETAVADEVTTQIAEPTPAEKPKRQSKKKKDDVQTDDVKIEVESPSPELEQLRAELAAMQEEKNKLEVERNNLTDTIAKLQEEVKITPQKIGKAIKEMGIEPLSVSRENPKAMTIESYNSMSDSARREWQRTHRADYLAMMHNMRINLQ